MSTLLLRLMGPMQSWGVQSHFTERDSGREPSKSGVVGLLCAALGRPRTASIADLAALRMGVRVDREGQLASDFHVAGIGGYLKASGSIEKKNAIVSNRYYLADAAFLVGLQGEAALLADLQTALRAPVWPLCLGRKSFVPSPPVWLQDGLRPDWSLETALHQYPCLTPADDEKLRVVLEDAEGLQVRSDHPLSFARGKRRFGQRRTNSTFFAPPSESEEVSGCIFPS